MKIFKGLAVLLVLILILAGFFFNYIGIGVLAEYVSILAVSALGGLIILLMSRRKNG